ncbi:MAG TPA: peptidyl-prolyl cis-trans isomerase [Sphingomonadaceae bacterium]|nr:peptidyl-prolyl cis-trans isomerase [Sphingomonadaceae bacterium]
MISFFRRALSSWLSIALFVLVVAAFVIGDVMSSRMGGNGGSANGEVIATVGKEAISATEISQRAQNALEAARQQNPGLDMPKFIAAGGLEQVIGQYVDDRVLAQWGRKHRVVASERLIDGEIASIPAFSGPTGKFDPELMRSLLAQRQITERELRADIASGAIRRQLLMPIAAGTKAPIGLVEPYASLLLEAREGLVGIVPVAAVPAGAAPSDADIAAYYKANVARYTVPERRVLRYAVFGEEQAKAAAPTEAEIAAYYKDNAAAYAARETRKLERIILPDEKSANAFAAKVKAGTSFDQAAREAGFQPGDTAVGEVDHDAFAKAASPAIAQAAFTAPQGGITQPVKGDLGWYVVKVEAVKQIAARPLAAVHDEIAAKVAERKKEDALNTLVGAVSDEISDGSSFEDIAKSHGLTVTVTPPLLSDGRDPDQPDYHAPPETAALLKEAFQASPEDDPTVAVVENGKRYAMLAVAKIVAAAPAPLTKVHDRVVSDLKAKRASDKAKAIAADIQKKVQAGKSMAEALAGAGIRLPPPQKAAARQMDLGRRDRPAPPPLKLLFTMKQGETKLIASDAGDVWFVVHLDKITPGDASKAPDIVKASRSEFAELLTQDHVQQFVNAAAKEVGVKQFPDAIAKLKARLSGTASDQ